MITIRRGQPEDLSEVQRLNRALFQYENDQGFYPGDTYNLNWPYEKAGTAYFERSLSDKPTDAVFVAESDGKIIGYMAAAYSSKAYRNQNPIAEIENMFVEESFRDRGVGSKLVAAFRGWANANKAAYIRVGAFASNTKALAFYHKCGFVDKEIYLEQPAA